VREALLDGFWPALRVIHDKADQRQRDGTMHEGDAEDAPFVRHKHDCLCGSFHVNRDTFASYFVVMCPTNRDIKSFWLARAITNPDLRHINMIQIQYWLLASNCSINMEMYAGCDTKKRNVWRKDCVIPLVWLSTNYNGLEATS